MDTFEIVVHIDMFDRIFTLLSEKNITVSKLSKAIGISDDLISQWKKGLQKPSLDVVLKIADYLGVSLDYLLGRSEEKYYKTLMTIDIYDEEINKSIDKVKRERGFKSRDQAFQYILQLGFEYWENLSDEEYDEHIKEIVKK